MAYELRYRRVVYSATYFAGSRGYFRYYVIRDTNIIILPEFSLGCKKIFLDGKTWMGIVSLG